MAIQLFDLIVRVSLLTESGVEVNSLNTNPGNPDKITVSELRNDGNFKKIFI
jgi:hypothetical protein